MASSQKASCTLPYTMLWSKHHNHHWPSLQLTRITSIQQATTLWEILVIAIGLLLYRLVLLCWNDSIYLGFLGQEARSSCIPQIMQQATSEWYSNVSLLKSQAGRQYFVLDRTCNPHRVMPLTRDRYFAHTVPQSHHV